MNIQRYSLTISFDTLFLGTTDLGSNSDERFTGFKYDSVGIPYLQAYQLLGFLKEAAGVVGPAMEIQRLRHLVERLVFVEPKVILLELPTGGEVTIEHRHRRVSVSPTGRRAGRQVKTILMRSEAVPAGTRAECTLIVYPGVDEGVLRELLNYGAHRGMGQWRSAEYGTFGYHLISLDE